MSSLQYKVKAAMMKSIDPSQRETTRAKGLASLSDMMITGQINNSDDEIEREDPVLMVVQGFSAFIGSALTFEATEIKAAIKYLKDTETMCERHIKQCGKLAKLARDGIDAKYYVYELQTCLADTWILLALLNFLTQEVGGYLRGPLLMRRSYKQYQKLNADLQTDKAFASDVARRQKLHNGIAFGLGLFNLISSLLPPSVLKAAEMFGLRGDLKKGLELLKQCQASEDMRAPFSAFGLLWYHSYSMMYFVYDESEMLEAQTILDESLGRYPSSVFFSIVAGRLQRLADDLDGAQQCYEAVLPKVVDFMQIRQIATYELGWVYFSQLDFEPAKNCFLFMRNEAKYTQTFYGYMAGACFYYMGLDEEADECMEISLELATGKKTYPLELFALDRIKNYKAIRSVEQEYAKYLIILELLYMWNTLVTMKHQIAEVGDMIEKTKQALAKRSTANFANTAAKNLERKHQLTLDLIEYYYWNFDESSEDSKIIEGLDALILSISQSKVEKSDKTTAHLRPQAFFEKGMLLNKMGRYQEALVALNEANNVKIKEYDLANRLNTRILGNMRRVEMSLALSNQSPAGAA